MIKIRTITEKESNQFFTMINAVDNEADFLLFDKKERKNDDELVKAYINKLNSNENSILLVAENEKGEFIGYIAGEQYQLKRLKHILNINIAIKKDHSNKHIGSQLTEKFIEHALRKKIHRLEATIVNQNNPSLALAKKFGFEIEGIKRDAVKINNSFYDLVMIAKIIG